MLIQGIAGLVIGGRSRLAFAGAVLFQRLAHGHTVHVLDNGDAGCLQGLKGLGPDM